MTTLGYLVLMLLLVLPGAWLFAEFKAGRSTRILLGVISFIWVGGCAAGLAGLTTTFRYNVGYGGVTRELIDASVRQLEAGQTDQVLSALKKLQSNFQPTYENRANYELLVSNAVVELKPSTD
jgi:hypothetical protein